MERAEFEAMAGMDGRHWWYRGRRRIVLTVLNQLTLPPGARVLDAGCGSGAMMDALEPFGTVFGADSSAWAVASARSRGHHRVDQAMVEHLPYETGNFDLVTCLDVIEHIPDDTRALAELWRVTAPGGHLLVTAPAYQALWSAHDSMNHHFRRYRASALRDLAEDTGWVVARATYFNSILLAPAAAVRLARKLFRVGGRRSELSLTPAALDRALVLPLRLEAALLRVGVRLPAGLSVLLLLRKPAAVMVDGTPVRVEALGRPALEAILPGIH